MKNVLVLAAILAAFAATAPAANANVRWGPSTEELRTARRAHRVIRLRRP
jgi:hypothetical protein